MWVLSGGGWAWVRRWCGLAALRWGGVRRQRGSSPWRGAGARLADPAAAIAALTSGSVSEPLIAVYEPRPAVQQAVNDRRSALAAARTPLAAGWAGGASDSQLMSGRTPMDSKVGKPEAAGGPPAPTGASRSGVIDAGGGYGMAAGGCGVLFCEVFCLEQSMHSRP